MVSQQPQQTGVLLIMKQHVQPQSTILLQHSQQAWIMSQQLESPLVHVRQTPESVHSTLHMPMVKLQQQTTTPFIMQQQLHMPPASMAHRFCTMLAAVLSSQTQTIFMPPVHFSNLKVHLGTIIQFVVGTPTGLPTPGVVVVIPGIPVRSSIMALDITDSFLRRRTPGVDEQEAIPMSSLISGGL